MYMMKIPEIIARLKNQPDQVLALTWVAKDYSKLDLIKDLQSVLDGYQKEWEEKKKEDDRRREWHRQNDEDYKDRCG